MSATYGLTPLGFVVKQQQEIISEIQKSIQTAINGNINLLPQAVFGQIVNIFSEREALIWQLGEAIAAARYPNGAEGTSVDNILALNNLRRLPATATQTNNEPDLQANGITLYGLVLKGTPGTVIASGSIIQSDQSPPLSFTLDNSVTIANSADSMQNLYLSNAPTQGSYLVNIVDPSGNALVTGTIPYDALAAQTQLSFSGLPGSTTHFGLTLTQAGAALTTANITTNGAYPTAASIQSGIIALSGYSAVTVSGSAGSYLITWGAICNPITTIANNTTGTTIAAIDSVQASFNNLNDSNESNYPYTDVVISTISNGFSFTFGSGTIVSPNPASSAQPQALMTISSNSMQSGSNVTNTNIVQSIVGMPAQAVGSATCEVTGPNAVPATFLSVIGSPTSGWASVTNQLDCIAGTNLEDDTAAITRRQTLLAEQANGPLQSIVEKCLAVTGVTASIGFQNLNNAALQNINFGAIPMTGAFTITIGNQTTASLAYNALASVVQTAVQALTGFGNALVTGTSQYGYVIDFNGSNGGQAIVLGTITNNTTGQTATMAFGRSPKAYEIVVQGGSDVDIANAILNSGPAGILTYGNTTVQVFDTFNNPRNISFSRPNQITFYVSIALVTDIFNIPGNSGSGLNPNSKFQPGSIATIQSDIILIGNSVNIGGTVIGFGTNGLIGAFNAIPGIVSYTLNFGTSPNPGTNTNVSLQSEQSTLFETFNVGVSYT